MARTTELGSLPRLALRLFSAVVCLSLAAAAVNKTADSDRNGGSNTADSLAAKVDRQVDIVQVYSEWGGATKGRTAACAPSVV